MTFRHATAVCLFTVALAGSSLLADGLIHKLPEDGTKVTYKAEFESTPPPPTGFKTTVTLSSVGKEMHDGKVCRWIELGFLTEFEGMKRNQYYKLLVPEEELKKGGDPIKNIVRAFEKQGDGDPRLTTKEETADPFKGPLPVLFGGPLKDVKPLEKTILETGRGNLDCTGTDGTYSQEKDGATFTANIKSLVHEKTPFGVAQLAIQFNIKQGDREQEGSLTLTVEKVSKGAKSELPDSK